VCGFDVSFGDNEKDKCSEKAKKDVSNIENPMA
jgi:hypothetical protein